jgi:quercetin dioxygenase-like cupin family protein
MWRVEMTAGPRGPDHRFDVEQLWTVVRGGATVTIDGATHAVGAGDTLVLPADVARQIAAGEDGFEALVAAPAGARALLADGTDRGTPPWIA